MSRDTAEPTNDLRLMDADLGTALLDTTLNSHLTRIVDKATELHEKSVKQLDLITR